MAKKTKTAHTGSLRRRQTPLRPPRLRERAAGVLLHPTSLPGPHGSGDLGSAAYRFADFLAMSRLRWWQMLPIVPIGAANSPYSSMSAFAGNPWLIGLERLVQDGLLARDEIKPPRGVSADRVRYPAVVAFRQRCLSAAFERFSVRKRKPAAYAEFCEKNAHWLNDFALFGALKAANAQKAWNRWPREYALRKPSALRQARRELAESVEYQRFTQFEFDRQWAALKRYCAERGIGLIGDLPIFVCHDSADVWANRRLYKLDRAGNPTVVTGVPPDDFTADGQLWGHPHYHWPAHRRDGFAWWIERFRAIFERFDAVRIDHFLGFNRVWNVKYGAKNARKGVWTKTPGDEFFGALRTALGELEIIAEDLGLLIPPAAALRDRWGFPGMRILQWAFGADARYDQPHSYPRHCAAYTGTHDNTTWLGWFDGLPKRRTRATLGKDGLTVRERTLRYLNSDGREVHWDAIRALLASVADTVVVPLQDYLGTGDATKMNRPATVRGNWEWRFRAARQTPAVAKRIADLVETYERGG